MLPTVSTGLPPALDRIARLHDAGTPVRLRLDLQDGTEVVGNLVSQTQQSLSGVLADSTARLIHLQDIRAIYLARRATGPTFILVAGVIVGISSALVGRASFPALVPFFPRVAGGLAIAGLVGIV